MPPPPPIEKSLKSIPDAEGSVVPSQMLFKTTCKISEREREKITLKEPLRSAWNTQGQLKYFDLTKNRLTHFLIHSIGYAQIEN
jgi:hypothetical protein